MSAGDEENRLRASLFIVFRAMRTVRKVLERNIFNVQPEWLLAIRSYLSQGQGVSTK
jgi:hypothetical protein